MWPNLPLVFTLSVSHENKYYQVLRSFHSIKMIADVFQVLLSQGICLGLSCGLCYIPSKRRASLCEADRPD